MESLKDRLDALADRYEVPEFVASDPVSIPRGFSAPEDIETAAFLTATIAWGNRSIILRNARSLMERMDGVPAAFVRSASDKELAQIDGFVHRTCSSVDMRSLVVGLREIGPLGDFFQKNYLETRDLRVVLSRFRAAWPDGQRHVSSIDRGSACKRLVMMLRWLVRPADRGVDLGLWTQIPPSALYIPLDVHAARNGRALGLLTRRTDDWRAVEELTASLRALDPVDPVRYDFALFGAAVGL